MQGRKKKNRFVKIVSVICVIALCAGLFVGCGKDESKDEQGRTVISVGGWPTKEGVELDNINSRKKRFEEANPDVVIEPDNWAFELKTFYAKAAGGQLPTLYLTHFTEVPSIIDSEYSADLSSVLKKRGYDGKFNPKIVELVSNDGKMMAFPYLTYVLGMAYNTEMYEKAGLVEEDGTPKQPKDWDEVVEFAVKIKDATGKPGIVFPTSNKTGGWIFSSVAWSFGVDFMQQDKNGKWKATFNTPEAVKALQWIKDLKWKYDVLPKNTLIDSVEYYKTFATGNAAMIISAGDVPRRLVQYGMTPDQIGMMAMPAGPKKHVTLLGGNAYFVKENATEDQIDAAIRWIETSTNFKATEEYKENAQKSIDQKLKENQLVGIKSMSIWSEEADSLQYMNDLIDKNANSNPNHVKLYNEFVANCPAVIQPEEPVCAQELYSILDGCIQEVLVNKDADCAELIAKAASDFQADYLDNLDY